MAKKPEIPRLRDPWSRFILDNKDVWEIFHETTHDPELRKLDDYDPFFKAAVEDAEVAIEEGDYDAALEAVVFGHGVRSLQWTWNEDMGRKPGPSGRWVEILAPLKAWLLVRHKKLDVSETEDVLAEILAAAPPGWNERNADFLKICGHPKAGGSKVGWETYSETLNDPQYKALSGKALDELVHEFIGEIDSADTMGDAIVCFALALALARLSHSPSRGLESHVEYKLMSKYNELLRPSAKRIADKMRAKK